MSSAAFRYSRGHSQPPITTAAAAAFPLLLRSGHKEARVVRVHQTNAATTQPPQAPAKLSLYYPHHWPQFEAVDLGQNKGKVTVDACYLLAFGGFRQAMQSRMIRVSLLLSRLVEIGRCSGDGL